MVQVPETMVQVRKTEKFYSLSGKCGAHPPEAVFCGFVQRMKGGTAQKRLYQNKELYNVHILKRFKNKNSCVNI